MKDKFNEAERIFKKSAGMDMMTATRVLLEKEIGTNETEEIAIKLSKNLTDYVGNKELSDDYKILFHLVLAYYIFNSSLNAYDEWIKGEAAEHNMKTEKYIKIIFDLK